jgi:hypothetical protein
MPHSCACCIPFSLDRHPSKKAGCCGHDPWEAYGYSKLYQIIHSAELNERLKGTNVISNAIHPGLMDDTQIFKGAEGSCKCTCPFCVVFAQLDLVNCFQAA